MTVDPASPLPLHVQVEGVIRTLLRRADHASGKPLPREVELANRLGVSRATVRQAMGRLVNEGVLERRRHAGTRVSQQPLVTRLTDWAGFTAEMTRQGVKLTTHRLEVSMRDLPAEVGYFFGVPELKPCLHLQRVRGDEAGPIVEFRSWFHPRLSLTLDDDFHRPLYELIEERSHVIVAKSHEVIGAMLADDAIAQSLACSVNDAILTRRRQVSDVGGKPVEWCDCFYRADRFTYSIELTRGKP